MSENLHPILFFMCDNNKFLKLKKTLTREVCIELYELFKKALSQELCNPEFKRDFLHEEKKND